MATEKTAKQESVVSLDYEFRSPVSAYDPAVDMAWELAQESREAWDSWQTYQRKIDSTDNEFIANDLKPDADRNRTYFEVVSRMAAVVMSHPDSPFGTEATKEWFRKRALMNAERDKRVGEVNVATKGLYGYEPSDPAG